MTKFVIDTKNFEFILEKNNNFALHFGVRGEMPLADFLGEKLYKDIALNIAEHLDKSRDQTGIAMQIYDKFEMYDRVLNIWIKEQVRSLENINPLSFPLDANSSNTLNPDNNIQLSTIENRYPEMHAKYVSGGIYENYRKKANALGKLEKHIIFYSLVFENKYEDALIVSFNKKI